MLITCHDRTARRISDVSTDDGDKEQYDPSLHVGLAVYSVLFGYELSREAQGLRSLVWIGGAWTALIVRRAGDEATLRSHAPPAVVRMGGIVPH